MLNKSLLKSVARYFFATFFCTALLYHTVFYRATYALCGSSEESGSEDGRTTQGKKRKASPSPKADLMDAKMPRPAPKPYKGSNCHNCPKGTTCLHLSLKRLQQKALYLRFHRYLPEALFTMVDLTNEEEEPRDETPEVEVVYELVDITSEE